MTKGRGPNPNSRFTTLGKVGKITTPFGGKTTQEGWHPGVDVAAPNGTPLKSPVSGIVKRIVTGRKQGENNFGNQLEIQAKNGDTFQFNHLNGVNVTPGQNVQKGQPVMSLGNTGATYSPSGGDPSNLDMRIVTAAKKYRNPTRYIKFL